MYCDWPELGRCCFCLPLRRGVLTFGYISLFINAFMIGMYSFSIHSEVSEVIAGRGTLLRSEVSLTLYCFELIFDAILIYGAHKNSVLHLKAFYYFVITTMVTIVTLQILDFCLNNVDHFGIIIELCTFTFAGVCIQLYLITLVRSLIKKLELSGPHVYDNQLHQIVSGEIRTENGIYNNTTVVPTDV